MIEAVQPPWRRVYALSALVALVAPLAIALALVGHLLAHDHHALSGNDAGVEIALHGHAHLEGTPPHGHSIAGGIDASLPGKVLAPLAPFVGEAPAEFLGDLLGGRASSGYDPTHDPPPRRTTHPILRI